MEEKLVNILNEMAEVLSITQMKKLQEVLLRNLSESSVQSSSISNQEYMKLYLEAKKIEGCSERTLQYYRVTIEKLLRKIEEPIRKINTEQIHYVEAMGHGCRLKIVGKNSSSFVEIRESISQMEGML